MTGIVSHLNHDRQPQEEDNQNLIVTEPMTGDQPTKGLWSQLLTKKLTEL